MTTAGNKSRELVQQAMQSQWRQVGVDARIRNEPARVFFGETVGKRKFKAMAMFAWTVVAGEHSPDDAAFVDDPDRGQQLGGTELPRLPEPQDGRADRRRRGSIDEPKRHLQLWHDIQTLYATDLPALPLFYRADPYIFPPWLKGVTPTGNQYPTTLHIEDWSVGK